MPTTINGIGTHYYGNSNRSARTGTCQSCGRVGNLQSYDTRLWFVIVFIPVVPLGRKRIIDECPSCRRHYAADQDQFAMAQQLSTSGAKEQFRSDPTPENALAAHAQMLGFHAHEDAAAFRDEVIAALPDDAIVVANLAAQLDEAGQFDLATPLYESAHEISPQLPEARDGLALRRLVEGDLDAARSLASHLEVPGAGQIYPLARLEQLAEAFRKAGRYEEARDLCAVILRELPHVAQHHAFREFVRSIEKKLPTANSILPPRERSWKSLFDSRSTEYSKGQRRLVYGAIVVVLAAIGILGLNEYRRHHRLVHVLNAFAPGARVMIDGTIQVPDEPHSQIELAEGVHHVAVTGSVVDEFDVQLASGHLERWTNSPAWIINVKGATPLIAETLYYAERPRPSTAQLIVGENFSSLQHVDYLFEPSPPSLDVGRAGATVTKRRLHIPTEPAEMVFRAAIDGGPAEAAFQFAEGRLALEPENVDLFNSYVVAAAEKSAEPRLKEFLKSQLDRRPVAVNWHRTYQEMHDAAQEKRELVSQYDAMLASAPDDAALLYLRGRVSPTAAEARSFFDRATNSDPRLGWPWLAKAYQASSVADWQNCQQFAEKAASLGLGDQVFPLLHYARLGLGQAAEDERELRQRIKALPPGESVGMLPVLMAAIAAQGNSSGAWQVADGWAEAIPAEQRSPEVANYIDHLHGLSEYLVADYAAVRRRVLAGNASPELKLIFLLATGKPHEISGDSALAPLLESPWNALALGLAFELAGAPREAETWRGKSCESLGQLSFDEERAARLLDGTVPPTRANMDEVTLDPSRKSLLAAVLGIQFPDERSQLFELAKQLNVAPGGYAPLVSRAIEK